MAPLVLPDSDAVGSEDFASCEWSDEVEIDGAGDGLGGCVSVLPCPFIVQELAGGIRRLEVWAEICALRVGTSFGAAGHSFRADKKRQISRIYQDEGIEREEDQGRMGRIEGVHFVRLMIVKPWTVVSGKALLNGLPSSPSCYLLTAGAEG